MEPGDQELSTQLDSFLAKRMLEGKKVWQELEKKNGGYCHYKNNLTETQLGSWIQTGYQRAGNSKLESSCTKGHQQGSGNVESQINKKAGTL